MTNKFVWQFRIRGHKLSPSEKVKRIAHVDEEAKERDHKSICDDDFERLEYVDTGDKLVLEVDPEDEIFQTGQSTFRLRFIHFYLKN